MRILGERVRRWASFLGELCAVAALCIVVGCAHAFHRGGAGNTATLQEPENAGEYILYTPSHYDRDRAWPLIVICSSGFLNSPGREIDSWSTLAESEGFIVAAAKLRGASASLLARSGTNIEAIREDEGRILSIVRHVRGSHEISEDRIFIFGFGSGASAALLAGLHNPRIFRAISIAQPKFDEGGLGDFRGQIDPHQLVFVSYGSGDKIAKEQGRRCADWLRREGADVRKESVRVSAKTDAQRSTAFFRTVIGSVPWIHIKVIAPDPAHPLQVQCSIESHNPPTQLLWHFSDGDESQVLEPMHTFAKPGTYIAAVTLDPAGKDAVSRAVAVTVPGPIVRPAPVPAQPRH